ncbi:MAG TPA: fumarylacetoacetate hydrolase family protein [Stellaceae bacterium]|nr:fumarylacetoacetate hydrolase family protein [Stellaceae bacterium]
MRLISYRHQGRPGVGVMANDEAFVALSAAAPDLPSNLRLIITLPDWQARVRRAIEGRKPDLRLADVKLDPVIIDPNAIWALALNFQTHIEETGLTTSKEYPQIFLRHAESQVGAGEPILCPPPSVGRAYDYEGELAVIIGRGGRFIPRENAMDHVAGYSIYNEGSVREFQSHNRQFGLGKNFERSGSFGPWLMTPDEFGSPYDKLVMTRLNGVTRQRESIGHLIFKVEDLIHYLSTGHKLRPGDVIVTGTPGQLKPAADDRDGQISAHVKTGGVQYAGRAHMKPGDVCEVEIEGLGILRNPVIGDEAGYRAD